MKRRQRPPMTTAHIGFLAAALFCQLIVLALLWSISTAAVGLGLCLLLGMVCHLISGDSLLHSFVLLGNIATVAGFGLSGERSTGYFLLGGLAIFGAMQFAETASVMRREAIVDSQFLREFSLSTLIVGLFSLLASAVLLGVAQLSAENTVLLTVSVLAAAVSLAFPVFLIRRRSGENSH